MRIRNETPSPDRVLDLRRRSLLALLRSWMVLSAPAVVLILLAECAHDSARIAPQAALVALTLLHLSVLAVGNGLLRRLDRPATPPAAAVLVVSATCALAGALWGLATWQFPSGPLRYFLVPSLLYAGVLFAPALFGALPFTLAVMVVAALGCGIADGTRIVTLACGASACATILWRHLDFARGARAQLDVERQGAIIGILLHDFEEQGSSWLWETDAEFRLVAPSEHLLAAVGCTAQALQALSLRRWIAAKERRAGSTPAGFAVLARAMEERGSFRNVRVALRRQGEVRWLLLTGKPLLDHDGGFKGYRGIGTDVTATERSERQLAWLARHDSLTRLPNRAHFRDAVTQSCDDTMIEGTPVALLCLDLDGFKEVNDTLGHPAGDALLFQVARRLRGCLRAGDMAGRLGGDEFALLMHDADRSSAEALANRVLARISEPFDIDGGTVRVGVSIGIMLSVEGGTEARALFKGADTALYDAKQAGRGTVRVFTAGAPAAVALPATHSLNAEKEDAPGRSYPALTA